MSQKRFIGFVNTSRIDSTPLYGFYLPVRKTERDLSTLHVESVSKIAFSDYVTLTKPRIILLLIVTAIGSMFLAANGVPKILTLLLVITSGSLGAGGANALNHYFDRDIDEQMKRTSKRPVPGGRIKPNMAFLFGVILNIIALTVQLHVVVIYINATSLYIIRRNYLYYAICYYVICYSVICYPIQKTVVL